MTRPIVYVIDGDEGMRDGLSRILRDAGLDVRGFDRPESLFASFRPEGPACLVVDLQQDGVAGVDLLAKLKRRRIDLPTVFLVATVDVQDIVAMVKAGAIDVLARPVSAHQLLDRVLGVLERAAAAPGGSQRRRADMFVGQLSRREREVLQMVAAGHSNKSIADALGISVRTVEVHRSRILHKTGARSMMELALSMAEDAHRATPVPRGSVNP